MRYRHVFCSKIEEPNITKRKLVMKRILATTVVSLVVAISAIFVYANFFDTPSKTVEIKGDSSTTPVHYSNFDPAKFGDAVPVDFTVAASLTTPAVVHVKKTFTSETMSSDPFRDFFGDDFFSPFFRDEPREQVASGSGVIIDKDGLIVTNNHVISHASEIMVTLFDKKEYVAELVGTDPSTDIALLKIEASDLPYVGYGNSDEVSVGEWVMAVGNPFDLTSTVTAGIVSAKGRNINILRGQSRAPIESFIQTDAAVNPGNSGGALVNLKGELVGINTAIATPTGTFAGYSFAVPVNIVKKVIRDLKEYGVVQRAFLGINITDITNELADELGIEELEGVYVANVNERSGAMEAGLKEGDVIVSVNGVRVTSASELQEEVSMHRPGERVTVKYLRNKTYHTADVTLKNQMNTTEIVAKESSHVLSTLGADFADLSEDELEEFNIKGGVKVENIFDGKIAKSTDIREGFIITKVDYKRVYNVEDLTRIISKKEKGDGILIEGFYPNRPNRTEYFAFGL